MAAVRLALFIDEHRHDVLYRCREKAKEYSPNSRHAAESPSRAISLFLDQVVYELRHESSIAVEMRASAIRHGRDLFFEGVSIGQVVHDYGAVGESVTDLAVEIGVSFSSDDFRTLNRCLDDAIATAVAEYANQERIFNYGDAQRLRNLACMAATWFDEIRQGKVGVAGGTGDLLQKSLLALTELTNRTHH